MRVQPPAPALPDILFIAIALTLGLLGADRLTQSDGDLFAHIRLGQLMLETGRLPATSTFGATTSGAPMLSPSWLSDLSLAAVFQAGGLAAVAALAAVVIASAHATAAWMLRRHGVDARWILVTALLGLALGATHWLARPHMFSLLGAAVLVALMERNGRRMLPAVATLFLLWTNLHGGWTYGLGIIVLMAAGDTYDGRRGGGDPALAARARRRWGALGVACAATLVNPYGLRLHAAVWKALTASTLGVIDEHLPPAFRDPGDLAFLVALLATIALLARPAQRIPTSRLLVILANVALALLASRNIALFALTAWPLVALESAPAASAFFSRRRLLAEFARADARARSWLWAPLVAAALLGAVLAAGRRELESSVDPRRYPVTAVARMRAAPLDGAMFTEWTWGGYVTLAWPGHRAFIDPLYFDEEAVSDYGEIAMMRPGWRRRIERWNVKVALLPRGDPLASALAATPEWSEWYADSTAVVLRRAATPLASRTR